MRACPRTTTLIFQRIFMGQLEKFITAIRITERQIIVTSSSQSGPLLLGHAPLTIADVVRVARHNRRVQPMPTVARPGTELAARLERVERSAAWVRHMMDEIETSELPRVIYGVNTGFGDNAGRAIFRKKSEAALLSRNLLLSHAVGVGDYLPLDVVRATMLIRAHTLAQGYSGVRREIIDTLVDMLNEGVLPAMPAQGSLGASRGSGPAVASRPGA